MKRTAEAAKNLGVTVVNGFTGSSIWHLIYDFPPTPRDWIEKGFQDFADRWKPILDHFHSLGVKFALEVHPTEIAFDFWTAKKALEAIDYHPAFGFNLDPSHLVWQGVDPVQFVYEFGDRIFHVHLKDSKVRRDGRAGILSSMLPWGDPRRGWDFRSLGHGDVNFPELIRALNAVGYQGPLSVEWEDMGMDREYGAKEACQRAKSWEFEASKVRFDEAFAKK
jgi:sugar phosphate isomerase/epimerase